MKVDLVKSLVAVAFSALLAYACYEICDSERVRWVVTIGALLTIGIPSLLALGSVSKNTGVVTIWAIFLINSSVLLLFSAFSAKVK